MSTTFVAAKQSLAAASVDEQKQIVREVTEANPGLLPTVSADKARLWMALIIGVLVVAVIAIAGAVILSVMGHAETASASWPIASAAIAGLLGLFAKSPTS